MHRITNLIKHVNIRFPSGLYKKYDWPVYAQTIAQDFEFQNVNNIVALKVNQLVTNLNELVPYHHASVEAIPLHSPLGYQIYRRSLVFLLGMASYLELPEHRVTVEHHLPNGKRFSIH